MSSLILILATLAAAPNDPAPLTAGDVFNCNFEEPFDRNYDGWPDGWTRQRSRELPEFLKIGIVRESTNPAAATEPASSGATKWTGNQCLQIDLNGGGAVISSAPQPISTRFTLVLKARIKATGLVHDGAWVELALLDSEGNVVQRKATTPLTTAAEWTTVEMEPIAAVSEKVTHVVISVHVRPLGKHEDLKGQVWFDDLQILRLPRMRLTSSESTGIYTKREAVEMTCSVSGIHVRNPRVKFELFDEQERLLAESTSTLLSTQDSAKRANKELPSDGYAGQTTWTPPITDYGFYQIRAALLAEDAAEVLLGRTKTVAVLRPFPVPKRSAFGWSLPGGEDTLNYAALATLLGQAGLGWAKIPLWHDPKDSSAADRAAWFAEQLSIQGIELVGVLDQPPSELRAVFREQGRLEVATVFSEPELWQPAVAPTMTRLSLKVHWWQLGNDSDVSFFGHPQLESKVAEIKKLLEQSGQQIHLALNWKWIYAAPKTASGRPAPWSCLSFGIDPQLTAEEISAYVPMVNAIASTPGETPEARAKTLSRISARSVASVPVKAVSATRAPPLQRRWMLLAPLPRGEYSSDVRLQDFVQRMLAAKMNGAHAVFLPQPFSDEQGVLNTDGSPSELFVPWRTTAMLIGGTEYLGPIQLPGGSVGHVFAQGGNAVMALWNDRATTERVELAEDVEQIDLWGRATTPKSRDEGGRKLYELPIGPLPTFITGLSEAVARWQSAVAFENSQLASIAGREQVLQLRLKNTFPQGVSGELTLYAPKSWGFDSRPTRFKVSAGEELRLPLAVTLMADANSGPQPVRLDFDVGGYRFSAHRTLQLGLDDVQVEMTSGVKNGSLIVEQHLMNLSDKPLSFQCVLFAPDRRRQTRQVLNLGRERTTLKFVLPEGEELIGKKLWLRAEEIGGSRVLNYTLVGER